MSYAVSNEQAKGALDFLDHIASKYPLLFNGFTDDECEQPKRRQKTNGANIGAHFDY